MAPARLAGFRVFLLAALLAWSPGLVRGARAVSYRNLEPGLDYGNLSPDASTKVHLLKVDLKHFKVKVLDARDWKSRTLPVKSFAEKSRALAAINANFFDPQDQPLGLVLQEGKLKSPPKKISWWAALLLKGDRAAIEKAFEKDYVLNYENGVQAGPRLVVGGRAPKLKEEFSPKSAIGVDRQGHLVFVVTQGSIEINQLAQLLAKKEKDGGVGLANALNLDGGSSAQFFAKVGDLDLSIPGFATVPIALGLFRK
ncbi:MAG: phosphodiester glycosidase family protein [bacterium]